MKVALAAAAMGLFLAVGAHAAAYRVPATQPLYACVGEGISRVALTVSAPAPCCDGELKCAQYLATTSVVRPKSDHHT